MSVSYLPPAPRPERADLLDMAARHGIDLQAISEERAMDLAGRVRAGDIDGVAEMVGVEPKRAQQLVRSYDEMVAGVQERKALRTPDARKLARDLVSIFAAHASSGLGRSGFSVLAPTLRRDLILSRLSACTAGRAISEELARSGRKDELLTVLAGVSFDGGRPAGKRASSSPPRADSETMAYFQSRRPAIGAALAILTRFGEVRSLRSFLGGTDGRVLEEVTKALDDYDRKKAQGAEAVLSDAEILINEGLREGGRRVDEESARRLVEERVDEVVGALRLDAAEEGVLRRAASEGMSIPFEFERTARRRLVERWEERQREERAAKLARTEALLKTRWGAVEDAVERVVSLDRLLAIASTMEEYRLAVPTVGDEGIAFQGGRNIFLVRERLGGGSGKPREVRPVSYSLGRTASPKIAEAKARNVVMLTGANSGGKTTLLTTLASIHILTLLGLPSPCESAEVVPIPIYLFRRKVTRKIGSLEQALSSLIPVFADRHRKLVLMDEFEALTEPGAAGRILASIMNDAATGTSLLLLVTHLARETIPHVKLPIRVDGIEAEGLDREGELVVDRQPRFNHIGSSTPKLIIMKLAKAAKKSGDKALYADILGALEAESSVPVQTPLSLSWLAKDDA
ncbi:MAG: hypothetical protein ABSF83_07145 [Nitrososphaerales archaeon]|jgi:hypothetical protein